jgi:hypothetical protein
VSTPGFQMPHAQCMNCGKIYRSPTHEGQILDQRRDAAGSVEPVYVLDTEGPQYREEAEAAGKAYNVAHAMCPECYQETLTKYRQHKQAIEGAQAGQQQQPSLKGRRAAVREQRRAAHERHARELDAQREYVDTVSPAERARRAYRARGEASARAVEGKTPDTP